MSFTCKVGDTLFLSDIGGSHRYLIITNPNSAGNVVLVNFTSAKYWKEWLVTFSPRDDKGLFDRKTTVNYADARICPAERLRKEAQKRPRSYEFCAENHVKRIVIGALQSRHTPIEVLRELKTQYPIEYKKYCGKDCEP